MSPLVARPREATGLVVGAAIGAWVSMAIDRYLGASKRSQRGWAPVGAIIGGAAGLRASQGKCCVWNALKPSLGACCGSSLQTR